MPWFSAHLYVTQRGHEDRLVTVRRWAESPEHFREGIRAEVHATGSAIDIDVIGVWRHPVQRPVFVWPANDDQLRTDWPPLGARGALDMLTGRSPQGCASDTSANAAGRVPDTEVQFQASRSMWIVESPGGEVDASAREKAEATIPPLTTHSQAALATGRGR